MAVANSVENGLTQNVKGPQTVVSNERITARIPLCSLKLSLLASQPWYMAEEAKAKGNASLSAGRFEDAIRFFSEAIGISPTNHVLYSNHSVAYAALHRYSEALVDAKKTVDLEPDWSKGYSRLAAAHLGLTNYEHAIATYKKGLELNPSNEALKSGLTDAQAAAARSRSSGPQPNSPFGNVSKGTDARAKLTTDPTMRSYLQQLDFLRMLQGVQQNPNNLNKVLMGPLDDAAAWGFVECEAELRYQIALASNDIGTSIVEEVYNSHR